MAAVLADLVLTLHLLLAVFIALGLFVIPLGARLAWSWIRNRRLRQIHAGALIFVALEAAFGLTCPLTILEFHLREAKAPEYFLADLASRVLYWDLPPQAFLGLYVLSTLWAVLLWKWVPPNKKYVYQNRRP
jgi:hypothetical protein